MKSKKTNAKTGVKRLTKADLKKLKGGAGMPMPVTTEEIFMGYPNRNGVKD